MASTQGSRYGGRQGDGGGRGNAQILPYGQQRTGELKPRGLLSAISDIQRYYVMERGQDIPGEFLTIEGSLDYFKIGAKSGFGEGLLLFLLFPLMEFWFIPFMLKNPPLSVQLMFAALPAFMIAINTGLCAYVGKFYIGRLTRKAINSLFVGRSMALIAKGILIFLLYYFVSHLATPKNVWSVAKLFGDNAESFYYRFFEMKPHIIPAGVKALVFLTIGALGPYGAVYMLDWWRRHKIRRNLAFVTSSKD